jgi:hypothetical protein
MAGFCCLGVACMVFIPENIAKTRPRFGDDSGREFLVGDMPDSQPHAPKWVNDIDMDFELRTGTPLSSLNDGSLDHAALTFDEIADVLEAVYLEKVLDEVDPA